MKLRFSAKMLNQNFQWNQLSAHCFELNPAHNKEIQEEALLLRFAWASLYYYNYNYN